MIVTLARIWGRETIPDTEPDLTQSDLPAIQTTARSAAEVVGLPFRAGGRTAGNLLANESGSSLEFRDHRPYLAGDDPRQIDWSAFARTEQYILKVFHQEASPSVELLLDLSGSMTLYPAKLRRTLELAHLCLRSALRSGSTPKISVWSGTVVKIVPAQSFLETLPEHPDSARAGNVAPPLERLPSTPNAIRILISDLLYPPSDARALHALSRNRGRGIALVPFHADEATPRWPGQAEFLDCESDRKQYVRVSPSAIQRYRAKYASHFELWKGLAVRSGVLFARVSSHPPLLDALREEAVPSGAVEPIR